MHAANVVARNYSFRPQSGQKIEPTVENVARIIDYSTRLPQMLPVLKDFSESHPWYEPKQARRNGHGYVDAFVDWVGEGNTRFDAAARLEDDIERVRDGVRQLEMAYERMPKLATRGIPCGAAWNAAKNLCKIFSFAQRSRVRWSERNLALIVDTSANCFRVQVALELILGDTAWTDPAEMLRRLDRVREAMRVVELAKNMLPDYAPSKAYTVREVKAEPPKQRFSQAEVDDFRQRLSSAARPQDEQQILRDWRTHTNV